MSVYPPPSNQQGSIWNNVNWETSSTNITLAYLQAHFCEYPIIQGNISTNNINTNGSILTSGNIQGNSNLVLGGVYNTNYLQYPDTSKQYTAFPGLNYYSQLGGGTSGFPQIFTGYNQFNNQLISNGNLLINGSGNYLQYSDGSRQTTAYIPTSSTIRNWTSRYIVNGTGFNLPQFSPSLTITGYSSLNYWDSIDFTLRVKVQENISSTTTNDAYGQTIFNSSFYAQQFQIFPKAFTTCTPQNVFWLNNGINSSSTNTSYNNINSSVSSYTPYGRPFFSSVIENDGNIVNNLTITTFSDGTNSTLYFNFPPLGLNTSAQYIFEISLQLINIGAFSNSNISYANWNQTY